MGSVIWMALGWGCCLIWLYYLIPVVGYLHSRRLEKVAAQVDQPTDWPFLTVIVPARNEASEIEVGLRSLLGSDYPHLEILAIDDRSTDQTGQIMDRLAAEDPRLRVIHVIELPPDWLGKTHAMHLAATAARGSLLVFTDGDVQFHPTALRMAVRVACAKQLDHLALFPHMRAESYLEYAFLGYFGMLFMMGTDCARVGTPSKHAYAGIGAFNLVRKSAYDATGGYQHLRLEILDDVKLGKLLKQQGFRQEILLASQQIHLRWQTSVWGIVRGLEKNAFASLEYSVARLVLALSAVLCSTFLPLAGCFISADFAVWGFMCAALLSHLGYGYVTWKMSGERWLAPALVPATVLFVYAYIRSAVITLRQGGIRWRETFYPLSVLKSQVYRGESAAEKPGR